MCLNDAMKDQLDALLTEYTELLKDYNFQSKKEAAAQVQRMKQIHPRKAALRSLLKSSQKNDTVNLLYTAMLAAMEKSSGFCEEIVVSA